MSEKFHNSIRVKGIMIVFLFSFTLSAVVYPCECAASMWSETYGGTGTDAGTGDLIQTSDGGYAISGDTNSFGAGGNDYWLIKTDADGNMQWNKTYGGTGTDAGWTLIQTIDGGYTLAGYTSSFGAGGTDFYFVKTDEYGVIPEGLTFSAMLLLSTVATIQHMHSAQATKMEKTVTKKSKQSSPPFFVILPAFFELRIEDFYRKLWDDLSFDFKY